MNSSARCAQFGLCATGLVLVCSLVILGGRAAEWQKLNAARAPDFQLPDTDGQSVSLSSLRGNIVVLVFSSVRCPLSNEYADRIVQFANCRTPTGGVKVLLIDISPGNGKAHAINELRVHRSITGQTFPTLIDDSSEVARLYQIAKTPTVCIIDQAGLIRYRGPFDDNRNPGLVKRHYCGEVVAALLAEKKQTAATFTQAFGRPLDAPK